LQADENSIIHQDEGINNMKRLMQYIALVVAIFIVAGTLDTVNARTLTMRGQQVKVSGIKYLQFDFALRARLTDTVYCVFGTKEPSPPCDSLLFRLYPYVARSATDSVLIGHVGFQSSVDGSTWATEVTIGTDSTTWLTTDVFPIMTATTGIVAGTAVYGAWAPFGRLVIRKGGVTNLSQTRWRFRVRE